LTASSNTIDGLNHFGDKLIFTDSRFSSYFTTQSFRGISDISFKNDIVYVTCLDGLYISEDFGVSFFLAFSSQTYNTDVYSVDVNETNIVLGTLDGLFLSNLIQTTP
jgi:hypothetical protein